MTLGPVVLDIAGKELTVAERERLRHPLVGMVILFSRNYDSPGQLERLCAEIHALRDPPLLVSVDHEGGRVQRFRKGFTHLPPMAALGAVWDRDVLRATRLALSAGVVLGAEMRAHGVDFTYAPVVDLDWGRSEVIGDRAFHRDGRVVSWLAAQVCHGLALAGVSNCAKHFPGHGFARADSHVALPVDDRTLEDILASDIAPYGSMGVGIASIMLAHITYPQVDPLAAGFSRRWIGEVLRERLGFEGAIFTDDLSMQGARVAGTVERAAQMSIDAGCDLLLVCNDAHAADRVLATLRWARGPNFDERCARLAPRTPPGAANLDARYRRALADVLAWKEELEAKRANAAV
jgi:beta-N-acetylhexosaminidase